jgi:hypothetical protein
LEPCRLTPISLAVMKAEFEIENHECPVALSCSLNS